MTLLASTQAHGAELRECCESLLSEQHLSHDSKNKISIQTIWLMDEKKRTVDLRDRGTKWCRDDGQIQTYSQVSIHVFANNN